MLTAKLHGKTNDLIDNALPASIKIDDKQSFERMYNSYWSELYVYAFNVLREKEICEDIVQEIFIDLWTRRHTVQISNLNSYLYQSVKFQIFNHFRKCRYKTQLLMEFDFMIEDSKIEESFEKNELKARINDVISKLPEQRRTIFQMSRHEGLSNKEISESLNISLQTVKNQISESLKFIRKYLKHLPFLFFSIISI